ncbi:MAG: patatin-like phospholipase family protein [Leptospira sp.]|nr:patatin-like phospholipase family protein [Leptospira sp.]
MDSSALTLIRDIPLCQFFSDKEFEKFGKSLELISIDSGETLFYQGDDPDGFYFVLTGRLYYERIIYEYGNVRDLKGEFSRGSVIGEIAVLSGSKRTASVIASRDSELLFLSLENWKKLLMEFPETFIKTLQFIFHNFTNASSSKEFIPQRMISILSLSKSIPEDQFSENLKKSLEKYGKVCIIRRDQYEKLSISELRELFNRLEKENQFTIFETSFDEEWTKFCFNHSDRIIILDELIGSGNLRSEEKEFKINYDTVTKDLVILAPDSTTYFDYNKWTAHRNISSKFLIDLNSLKSFNRLARHISGNSIGIALGGGGARGFAHIGVMQGLSEMGIEVDMISGTSIGSIIGSLYALRLNNDEILSLVQKYFVDRNPTGDIHFSPIALTKGEVFTNSLKEAFGNKLIESMYLPFFAVACNLTKESLHIFNSGEIWKALRASSSIPGLSPPILINNDLYIDGGLLNNLPCDILKNNGMNIVIGVDIAGQDLNQSNHMREYFPKDNPGVSPSFLDGWKYSIHDFLHGNQTPIIMELLVSSGMVGSKIHKDSILDSIDLLISPDVNAYGLLDWKKMDELIVKGKEAVASMEEQIKKVISQ